MTLPLWTLFSICLFAAFGTINSIDFCPANCPTSCTIKTTLNVTAIPTNGVVYVGSTNLNISQQTGEENTPFSKINYALEGIRKIAQNITIEVEPGTYTVEEILIDESFNGTFIHNFQLGPLPRYREIILKSTETGNATIECNGTTTFMRIAPSSSSGSYDYISFKIVLDGFVIKNCDISSISHHFEMKNTVFEGGSLEVYNGDVSIFMDAKFLDVSQVYVSAITDVLFSGCSFDSPNEKVTSIVLVVSECTYLQMERTDFSNVRAQRVFQIESTEAYIDDTHFYSVYGVSILVGFGGSIYMTQSTFTGMQDSDMLFFINLLQGAKFFGDNLKFENNNYFQYAFVASDTRALVTNSNFQDNEGFGQLDSISFSTDPGSHVTFESCTFKRNFGLMIGWSDNGGKTVFDNCTFIGNQFEGQFCGGQNNGRTSSLELISSNFQNNSMLLSTYTCNITIFNTTFRYNTGRSCGLFDLSSGITVSKGSTYIENKSPLGGVFCFKDTSVGKIESSSFLSNSAKGSGGSIFCEGCELYITSSTFTNNYATNKNSEGGAITIMHNSITMVYAKGAIERSIFTGNTAGLGGAIFAWVFNSSDPITFTNLQFIKNTATKRGGAFFSGDFSNKPIENDLQFVENKAFLSGDVRAGPAVRIELNENENEFMSIDFSNYSGFSLPPFTVVLKDSYNEVVFLNEDECMIVKATLEPSRPTSEYKAEAIGEIQKAMINGESSFSKLRVVGNPGSYNFLVSSQVKRFSSEIFRIEKSMVILDCPLGKVNQSIQESTYTICVDAICPNSCLNGFCLQMGECSCEEGWKGVSCQLRDREVYYPKYSSPEGAIFAVITAIMIVVDLIFGVTIYLYQNTPVIKSSSPYFCMAIVFGILLAYISIFTFIGEPNESLCTANLWLVNIAFSMSFSNLIAKNWRVYRIFNNKQLKFRPVSQKELVIWITSIVGMQMILLIVWTSVDLPTKRLEVTDFTESYVCGFNKNGVFEERIFIALCVYNAILLSAASWLAFKTRKVSSAFRESSTIAFSVYNTVVICVIAIPLIYLTGSSLNPRLIFIIKAGAVLVVATFGLMILFGPKIYIVYFAKHKNVLPKDRLVKNSSTQGGATMSKISLSPSVGGSSVYSGLLSFRGKVFRRWKESFVEFYPSVCMLAVYQDDQKSEPGTMFDLKSCTVMAREDYLTGCFMVTNMDGSFLFQAEDKKSASDWIRVINASRKRFMSQDKLGTKTSLTDGTTTEN